MCSLYIFW